jgi:zinc transport system substrate-binding protein
MANNTLRSTLGAAMLALFASASWAQAEIKVVASIKPVHSLVSAVMEGVGNPELIVQGSASPHTYSLKPSQAESLQNADLVLWIGPKFEAFLEKPLETIGANATAISLVEVEGLIELPLREGGAFDDHVDEGEGEEAHDHAHDHSNEAGQSDKSSDSQEGAHGDDEFDAHVWLDPRNAAAMTTAIVSALSDKDPANAAAYATNGEKLQASLAALEADIAAMLKPVQGKGFIVFHDAFQYFENRFGVPATGSITANPDALPGAERLAELRAKITDLKAECVFAEPNFEPKMVNTIIEGTEAKTGTLDPEAAALTEGPALYGELMRGIATSIRDCLADAS